MRAPASRQQENSAPSVPPRPPATGSRLGAYAWSILLVLLPLGLAVAGLLVGFWGRVAGLLICAVGAFGHTVIYEAVLRLRHGRAAAPTAPDPEEWPSVTLLVAAHNEEKVIVEKMQTAIATKYPGRYEIVIASDGSDDKTEELVEGFADQGVQLFRNPERTGKAGMLRRAVADVVRTDLVVFSDANAFYDPDAVQALARRFRDPSVGAVTGAVRLLKGEDEEIGLAVLERRIMNLESATGSCVGVDGAMVAVRKDLVPEYEVGTILDDFVLAVEVANRGYRVVFEERAGAYEYTSPTLKGEYKRRARLFAGSVQLYTWRMGLPRSGSRLLLRFVGHKVWRWCAPGFALATAWFVLLLCGWLNGAAVLLGGFLLLYLLLILKSGLKDASSRLGYLLVTYAGMLTGLMRGLFGLQKGAWERTPR